MVSLFMSMFWQLTVKPAQVQLLSELLQAIAEERRKIMEMNRKRVTLQGLVNIALYSIG